MRINGEFSNTLVKFFKDRDTDLVQEATLYLRKPMVKIIEVDQDSGNIYEKQYYPKEL